MYQAITTKYLGPTDFRGSRVKATAAAGSITLSWDDRWSSEQNHIFAAMQLIKKLNWMDKFHGGCNAAGGYVFVAETNTFFQYDYEPNTYVFVAETNTFFQYDYEPNTKQPLDGSKVETP